jgi:hypothetical protein
MKTALPSARRLSIGTLLLLNASACAANPNGGGSRPNGGTGTVIQGEELWATGGRLLDGLRGRVSTMTVARPAGACPQVQLRGQRTIMGPTRPEVYVDGTRMTDTCILDQIRAAEVKRVEIYPGGLSARAGYASSSNGLIVVFLVDGS